MKYLLCACIQPVSCGKNTLAHVLQAELDRFCNAMIAIREEIKEIEDGKAEK